MHAVQISIIGLFFGLKGMAFSLLVAFLSVLMLESVNYIEHYGLLRKKDSEGVYEPVNIRHSWNAPHVLTNYIFFKL